MVIEAFERNNQIVGVVRAKLGESYKLHRHCSNIVAIECNEYFEELELTLDPQKAQKLLFSISGSMSTT